ncbi:MAG TPA: hypothetical protein V6D48_03510 [Oculatellaceae cyanobacterium]
MGTSRYTIRYGVGLRPKKAIGNCGTFQPLYESTLSVGKYGEAHRNSKLED